MKVVITIVVIVTIIIAIIIIIIIIIIMTRITLFAKNKVIPKKMTCEFTIIKDKI